MSKKCFDSDIYSYFSFMTARVVSYLQRLRDAKKTLWTSDSHAGNK